MTVLTRRWRLATGLTRRITRALWFDTPRPLSLPLTQETKTPMRVTHMRLTRTH